ICLLIASSLPVMTVGAAGNDAAAGAGKAASSTKPSSTKLSSTKLSRWISHPAEPFDILATEATVTEFQACVAARKCKPDSADKTCNLGDASRLAYPINCIDHDGAIALCDYLGGRLCSSKEWLAACR